MYRIVVSILASGALASAACSSDSPDDTVIDVGADTMADAAVDVVDTTPDAEADAADGSGDVADDVEPELPPDTIEECFAEIVERLESEGASADYEQYGPVVGSHCLGTNHQNIEGIEKVVFFGDSITVGTPPSFPAEYYRTILSEMLVAEFGELDVQSFARFGARVDDLLLPSDEQLIRAFPVPEEKTTLVIMTVGGNDVFKWAEMHAEGASAEEINALVDDTITLLEDAINFFKNPDQFPGGVYVIFSNLFEFTDGTGDTTVCPLAATMGLTEPWPEGREPVLRFNEAVIRIATETQTDVIFMLEHFCGHGLLNEDPTTPCYRGPGTEQWVDATCIHPNPAGHAELARMFFSVVTE